MKKILTALILLSSPAYAQFSEMKHGVTISKVEDIEVGTNGSIIFATDNGLLLFSNGVWKHLSTSDGLSELHIKSIEPYQGGFIYTALNNRIGACNYTNIVDKIFTASFTFNYIAAVNINSSGDTLYGTDNGLIFLQKPSGQYMVPPGGQPLGRVTDINQLSGSFDYNVIATTDKILLFHSPTSSGFQVNTSTTPIPSNNVLSNAVSGSITYDGTDKGLYIADFTNFPNMKTEILNKANSVLPSDTISAIATSGNNVVVGTPKGIAIRRNNIWHAITPANSNLPPNEITEIAVNGNELWLSISELGKIYKANISDLATSVAQHKPPQHIKIYPNPAMEYLFIDAGDVTNIKLEIFTTSGKTVIVNQFHKSTKIDIRSLPPGQYTVSINNGTQIFYKTFIKTN